jgi:Tol biopolymer transport system component
MSGGIRWQVPSVDFGTVAWSPDGTRLAVVTPSEEGLTLYDARGAGILSVGTVGGAAWSPDSSTLAVNLIDGLALLPAEVGGEVQLIGPRWPASELTWSPDGASIVFSSTGTAFDPANPLVGEPPRHLYRLNVEDGAVTQLTDGPMIDHDPYFSPDGSQVIFKRTNAGTGGSEVFLTDGSGSFSSLGRVGWAANPWSPDGELLLLADQEAVWIATPGGEVIEIVARPHDTLAPIGQGWSPDGAFVLIAWQATLGDLITLEAVAVDGSQRLDLGTGYGASWQRLP